MVAGGAGLVGQAMTGMNATTGVLLNVSLPSNETGF
jgi:hypothetical protein